MSCRRWPQFNGSVAVPACSAAATRHRRGASWAPASSTRMLGGSVATGTSPSTEPTTRNAGGLTKSRPEGHAQPPNRSRSKHPRRLPGTLAAAWRAGSRCRRNPPDHHIKEPFASSPPNGPRFTCGRRLYEFTIGRLPLNLAPDRCKRWLDDSLLQSSTGGPTPCHGSNKHRGASLI